MQERSSTPSPTLPVVAPWLDPGLLHRRCDPCRQCRRSVLLALGGLAAAFFIGNRMAAPQRTLQASLQKIIDNPRTNFIDEVENWKNLGPLGALAGEVLAFNMRRREYYRAAILHVGMPFLICNKDGIITHASRTLTTLLRKDEKAVSAKRQPGLLQQGRHVHHGKSPARRPGPVRRTGPDPVGRPDALLPFHRGLLPRRKRRPARRRDLPHGPDQASGKTVRTRKNPERSAQPRRRDQRTVPAGGLGLGGTLRLGRRAGRGAQQQKAQADAGGHGHGRDDGHGRRSGQKHAAKTAEAADAANTAAETGAVEVRDAVSGIQAVAESAGKLGQVLTAWTASGGDRPHHRRHQRHRRPDQPAGLNAAIEAARAGEAGAASPWSPTRSANSPKRP